MKYLTERTEIAKAMNFGKYPVLTLNREDRPFLGSDFCRGGRVRVAWDSDNPRYEGMTTRGSLYCENGKLCISGEGACLKDGFGYSDVIKMMTEANTPIVHKGQTVVVVEDWPSQKVCKVRMMKVSDRIDKFCSTVAELEDIE